MRSSGVAWIVLLVGCREPIERLEAPNDPVPPQAVAPPPEPPRPPPPPPPLPQRVPPPVELVQFLGEAAREPEPWHITIHALADRPGGRRFRGHQIVRSRVLEAAVAEELVARLARSTAYVDGDVGCFGRPRGFRVARGAKVLELVEDCSHLYLTERGHDGRWVLFSPEMATFLDGLQP